LEPTPAIEPARRRHGIAEVVRAQARQPLAISVAFLIALVVAFTVGNDSFLSAYNVGSLMEMVTVLLAVGLGQACVIVTGGIDLSVGSIISLVSVVFMVTLGPLGAWAYPLVLLLGLACGFLNGLVVSRLRIPSFIGTLGTQGVLQSLAFLVRENSITPPEDRYGLLDLVLGKAGAIPAFWIISGVVFILFYVAQRFLPLGRHVFYVGANERMSWLGGLDVDRARVFAFTLAGFGAAVAGIVVSARLYQGFPQIGVVYVLLSIAVVVVGGTPMTGGAGGAVNTLVGALILAVIQNGLPVIGVDAYQQQVILGILVIIAVAVTFDRTKVAIIK
jgi:ribose/xylose/arabinose/galactoside ABC-type transport system permease subunit